MKKIVERVAGGAVIFRNGKVLIIQRATDEDYMPGLWEIPSGKREPSEKIADGTKRETMEETGLSVEIGDPVGIFEYKVDKPNEIREVTQICFLATPIGDAEVKLSNEHQNFAWISESEINKYNITEETKEIIRKAFRS